MTVFVRKVPLTLRVGGEEIGARPATVAGRLIAPPAFKFGAAALVAETVRVRTGGLGVKFVELVVGAFRTFGGVEIVRMRGGEIAMTGLTLAAAIGVDFLSAETGVGGVVRRWITLFTS